MASKSPKHGTGDKVKGRGILFISGRRNANSHDRLRKSRFRAALNPSRYRLIALRTVLHPLIWQGYFLIWNLFPLVGPLSPASFCFGLAPPPIYKKE
jgi:hypothetical protein